MANIINFNEFKQNRHNVAINFLEDALYKLAQHGFMQESMSDNLLAQLYAHTGRNSFDYRK